MCTGVGNFVRVPSRTYDLSARHGSAFVVDILGSVRGSSVVLPSNRVGAFILRSEFHPPIGRWRSMGVKGLIRMSHKGPDQ